MACLKSITGWGTVTALWLTVLSCTSVDRRTGLHFTNLPSSVTGIDFSNTITENDSLNMFVNEYTYMGGGIGVGDFNRDGLARYLFCRKPSQFAALSQQGKYAF